MAVAFDTSEPTQRHEEFPEYKAQREEMPEDLSLQLPPSPVRAHFVKAKVKVRRYPDRTLAVFHGPRLLARYDAEGQLVDTASLKAAA